MDMGLGGLQELVMDKEDLACCGSWGCKESNTTERLNWPELHSVCVIYSSIRMCIVVVRLLSPVRLFVTPWAAAHQVSLHCPSLSARVCSNSCPLSQWCHLIISSSVTSFSSYPQSFSASASFLMSRLFASGGQSIGVSVSTSVLPVNIQDWFPLGLIGLISLQSKVQAPRLLKIQRYYKGLKALHYLDLAAFLPWSSPTLSISHFFLVTLPPPSLNTPDTRSPQNFARSVSSTFLYVAYNQAYSVTLFRSYLWPCLML